MSTSKKVANIISIDGELHDEIFSGDKVKIIRNASMQAYRNLKNKDDTIEINKDKQFVKFYIDATDTLANENLTAMEYKICMKMLRYIQFESGLLANPENGKHLTKERIMMIVNNEDNKVTLRTIERGLETLTDKKIFAKTRVGNEIKYYINPFIFMKGQRINKTLYSMFNNTKWSKL